MKMKELLILLFLAFALNLTYQPASIVNNMRIKDRIVICINYEEDKITEKFLDNKNKTLFYNFIKLKTEVLLINSCASRYFDTS